MATAKKAAPAPRKRGVSADFLNSLTSELDNFSQYANGYGQLKSAVVEAEDNGVNVTATYDGREWTIVF